MFQNRPLSHTRDSTLEPFLLRSFFKQANLKEITRKKRKQSGSRTQAYENTLEPPALVTAEKKSEKNHDGDKSE